MKLKLAFILVLAFSVTVFAQKKGDDGKKYVQAKAGIVSVYEKIEHQALDSPVFQMGPDDRFILLGFKGNYFKVQNPEGQTGFVEKDLVIQLNKSKALTFESAEVVGYLDNPTPVYILDSDDPNAERIYLDRSFRDEVRDNVDQATMKRRATK